MKIDELTENERELLQIVRESKDPKRTLLLIVEALTAFLVDLEASKRTSDNSPKGTGKE